tara:strand:- start:621 stop:953 length:333 start_codon:yes stop_codon:yes gene_type:complete
MFKSKTILSIVIFTSLLILTSFVKNQTRLIEKNISKLTENTNKLEKILHESQIEFFYLSSPSYISDKIKIFSDEQYFSIGHSNIYSSLNEYKQNNFKTTNSLNAEKKTDK